MNFVDVDKNIISIMLIFVNNQFRTEVVGVVSIKEKETHRIDVSLINKPYSFLPSPSSDDIATPRPNVRIGSLHSPPNPQSCAPVSGCDDTRAPRDSSDSPPRASGSDASTRLSAPPSSCNLQNCRTSPTRMSALQMMSELPFEKRFC